MKKYWNEKTKTLMTEEEMKKAVKSEKKQNKASDEGQGAEPEGSGETSDEGQGAEPEETTSKRSRK